MSLHTKATTSLWINSTSITRKIDLTLSSVHGIGFSEYMVLFHLTSAPHETLRRIDLADALSRTASGVTRMLLPMEKIGLIEKEVNPRDARVSLVKITHSGKELFENASKTLDEKSKNLLRHVEDKDIEHLLSIFGTLSEV